MHPGARRGRGTTAHGRPRPGALESVLSTRQSARFTMRTGDGGRQRALTIRVVPLGGDWLTVTTQDVAP